MGIARSTVVAAAGSNRNYGCNNFYIINNKNGTGEGQEKDIANAMNTAFSTFKKSKNETVKAQIAEFDPKAEEDKVVNDFSQLSPFSYYFR